MTEPSPHRRGDAEISPLGVLVCILATLIAVPLLLTGQAEGEGPHEEVVVAGSQTTDPSTGDTSDNDTSDAGDGSAAAESTDVEAASPTTGDNAALTFAEESASSDEQALAALAAMVEASLSVSRAPAAEAVSVEPQSSPTTTAPPTTAAPTTAPATTAAPTTAPPTTAAPVTDPPTTEPQPEPDTTQPEPAQTEPSAEQWHELRMCESSNNYTVVSANGRYFGAYQFGIRTWDDLAARLGWTHLIGVRPNEASAADQDAMALALWRERGGQPWPICGRVLPPLP